MGVLANRLGLTKSAIYHHISSKEEILVEATGKALEELNSVVEAVRAGGGGSYERVRQLIEGATRVLCEYPAYVRLLLGLRGNTEVELEIMERRRLLTNVLVEEVRRAQESGHLCNDVSAGVAARLMFGMINSIVEWYHPGGAYGADELAGIVPRVLLEGVASARAE